MFYHLKMMIEWSSLGEGVPIMLLSVWKPFIILLHQVPQPTYQIENSLNHPWDIGPPELRVTVLPEEPVDGLPVQRIENLLPNLL